jgi:hypothetical protein
MTTTISQMVGIGLLIFCVATLIFIIYVSLFVESKEWRECLKCHRFFTAEGGYSDSPPIVLNVGPPGVCPDCVDSLDFGKQ